MKRFLFPLMGAAFIAVSGNPAAHPLRFNSVISYGQNAPAKAALGNAKGATFDADNLGGSGVNADGGTDNGVANDAFTYVAADRPIQGQSFTTGNAPQGYELSAVTVQMAAYRDNKSSGKNGVFWDLTAHNGPLFVNIGQINGADYQPLSFQPFIAGGEGAPGSGNSAQGAGTFITFHLPFRVHLQPNTVYGLDISVGNGSRNHFEWAGTKSDIFAGGAAFQRGVQITPLAGDRVFFLDIKPAAARPFAHPGTMHTQADLDRMKAKLALGAQPWKASFDLLEKSPYAQTNRRARPRETIIRGIPGNNYTPTQEDAAAIYQLALRYHLTGDKAFADTAVGIANAWSGTLKGLGGNSNVSLGAGIIGFQFACAGELLSTYPGWANADQEKFKAMMMRVFYPANLDFLWRKHDTFTRMGGNTHYRLNWDTCNMASMLAIGVLCDNRAVYEQAIDFFKYGPGNGRIERAAWYIHPNGMAQTEEIGRDQGHNLGGWDFMARFCQVAWNQGDDLYSYDNNRVLRALECIAKYNLGEDVPAVFHRNTSLTSTERLSEAGRGNFVPMYEMVWNHYANVKGIAAPYSQLVAAKLRPEGGPNVRAHPSQVDWFGFGSLTFSRDPLPKSAAPSGLAAQWNKKQINLYWWGSAHATGYAVKRAMTANGPFVTIGTTDEKTTFFTDANAENGREWFYVVRAATPQGELVSAPLKVSQSLVARYDFENNDSGALLRGAPIFAEGKSGRALLFDGVDDWVELPKGAANFQNVTLSAWVYWEGGGNFQRVFDFGSEIEKTMFLTPQAGNGKLQFLITTSRGAEGTGILEGPPLPMRQWSHVAVTLDGETGTLYVNGAPVESKPIRDVAPLFGQPYCYLGRSLYNADPLFKGRLDDFRIYNYALGADEIKAIAALGAIAMNEKFKIAAKPLFRDPVFDGAADPVVIWNRAEKKWWMFYTNRRANVPNLPGVSWVHGTPLGIAESSDGGATWNYKGTAKINYGEGENTFWAPDLLWHNGAYHMFLTFVPGIRTDWSGTRRIVHLTSGDLWEWKFESEIALASDKVIDAGILRLPDGSWRMFYNNEKDRKSIYYADSPDLFSWKDGGKVVSDRGGEGPKPFFWKGRYWMIVDQWRGLAVYHSSDALKWTPQEKRLLEAPGQGTDDGVMRNHADVVVNNDRAYLFYFTHPGRRGPDAQKDTTEQRRTSIQVVELKHENGELSTDRDAPTFINLQAP